MSATAAPGAAVLSSGGGAAAIVCMNCSSETRFQRIWSRWKARRSSKIFLNSGDLAECSAYTSCAALKPASTTLLGNGRNLMPLATMRLSAGGLSARYFVVPSL